MEPSLPNLSAERRYGEGSSCLKRVAGLCGRFSSPYVACRKLGARMAAAARRQSLSWGGVACKMCPSEGICVEVQDIPTKGGAWGLWQSGCAERTGMRGDRGYAAVRGGRGDRGYAAVRVPAGYGTDAVQSPKMRLKAEILLWC